jgi:hypothetical protein
MVIAKMKKIKLGYECLKEGIKFPDLNKNNTIEEYQDELVKGHSTTGVIIKQIIYVDNEEWFNLTHNFLNNYPDVWEKIGGHSLSEQDKFKISDYDKKQSFFDLTEEEQNIFRQHSRAEVTQLINQQTGQTCYINTEGYNYARYVGF